MLLVFGEVLINGPLAIAYVLLPPLGLAVLVSLHQSPPQVLLDLPLLDFFVQLLALCIVSL